MIGYASPLQILTAIAAAILMFGGAIVPLLRSRAWAGTSAQIVLAAGLSGVLVPLLLAVVGLDVVDTRNVLAALAPLMVLAAVGFVSPVARPWGLWAAAALAALSAAVVLVVDVDDRYQRADWGGASSALGAATVARAIIVSPGEALLPLQAYQPDLRLLGAPVAVRELDIVGVAVPVGSTGLGSVPEPPASAPIPAGLRPAGSVHTRTYTVLRYRASRPVIVSAPELTPLRPGVTGAILMQAPAERRAGPG